MSSYAFQQAFRAHPRDWTEASLKPLSVTELQNLAIVMAIPTSGPHQRLIERLLDMADQFDD